MNKWPIILLVMSVVMLNGCATVKQESGWPGCAALGGIIGGVARGVSKDNDDNEDEDIAAAVAAGAVVGGIICAFLPDDDQQKQDGDKDKDGVRDSADDCPDTAAGVEVDIKGCAADDDKDGVINQNDKCPNTQSGVKVDDSGCAIALDSDGDGVADDDDQCPGTAKDVRVDIKGCEIKGVIRLQGVTFVTNSDKLLEQSLDRLDEAAATLRKNPDLRVEVAGHTDSQGDAAYNKTLSQRRAEAVRDYLISKSVKADNLTARGYGEEKPIADNSTSAGRAQNRRVELTIIE